MYIHVCVHYLLSFNVLLLLIRYAILAPKAIPPGFMDGRKATEKLIDALQLDQSEFRLGHSKVFFRAGVLGRLEDLRDERLSLVFGQFQVFCRGFIMRRKYRKLQEQRLAIAVIQRNVRKHLFLRDWRWWKLFTKVKPLLNVARAEDELRQKEEEVMDEYMYIDSLSYFDSSLL